MEKRALQLASVASMIDLFNADNIKILHSLGYKVDVATNFEEGSITSKKRVDEYRLELKSQDIDTYQVSIPRSITKIRNIIHSYAIVKRLVEKNKYTLVHCHSPIGGVICRLACRKSRKLYGTKVIYTAHGFHFFKGASLIAWMIYYPIEKICSKYTDVIITINHEDYKNALKMKARRVEYIPGIGIHTEEIRNIVVEKDKIRSEFGFTKNDFVFMSTGQISLRKNHEVVIKALAKINDERIKYLIVGFGEQEKKLRKLVEELGIERRVVFAGYRQNVKEILHAVDAFVFPSIQEGLPVSLMEAMAVGLPIVCSKIRGNIDLIEDCKGGYLYDCYDIDGFAEGMCKIVNSQTKKMSDINLENISKFDSKVVNQYMQRIYSTL